MCVFVAVSVVLGVVAVFGFNIRIAFVVGRVVVVGLGVVIGVVAVDVVTLAF